VFLGGDVFWFRFLSHTCALVKKGHSGFHRMPVNF
jgi:hypothetical protein